MGPIFVDVVENVKRATRKRKGPMMYKKGEGPIEVNFKHGGGQNILSKFVDNY